MPERANMLNAEIYDNYISILKEELIPALGCTEPIALAYAGAEVGRLLGEAPDEIHLTVSRNIIKNVKSVSVPNACGLKGIEIAVTLGVLSGDPLKKLEVLDPITPADVQAAQDYLANHCFKMVAADNDQAFYIDITVSGKKHSARIVVQESHLNIVLLEKDGEAVSFDAAGKDVSNANKTDHSLLNISDIIEFAKSVKLEEVRDILKRQIDYNTAIAEEGIKNSWGANIGSALLSLHGRDNVCIKAAAMAAAGSDARMSGCSMPVVIVSGSGNQGITASVPVAVYAKEKNAGEEELLRALIVSDLVTIHVKTGIGSLSAFCGAVVAGAGAACGIAFLSGGGYEEIAHTLVNALGMISGTVCDGAKPSCAAKIAASVQAGILGYQMYLQGNQFYGGDGLIKKGVENTIQNIGDLARIGMRETDREIVDIMTR